MFRVPVVDIAPYVEAGSADQRACVAREVDTACCEVGLLQLVGHGIPEVAIAGLREAMDDFFALAPGAKRDYVRPAGEERGYAPPRAPGLVEAFHVGEAENTWPEIPRFEERVSAYVLEAGRVARTVTRILGDALGSAGPFLAGPGSAVLRMNHYAEPDGTAVDTEGDLVGMGEHTDLGVVTILWADAVAGLQAHGTDGGWHDVTPAPGALLVNLGDEATRLTDGRWRSAPHRVEQPMASGTSTRRRAAAYSLT